MSTVDLNADLGESFGRWVLGDDEAMLDVVTSANVACGFHAGDPPVLRRSYTGAAARDVRIGAQVSYRDLAGFGRRYLDVAPDDLRDDGTPQPRFPGRLPQVVSVPPRNLTFTGRSTVLTLIREGLGSGMTIVLPRPQTLFGLGGVGADGDIGRAGG